MKGRPREYNDLRSTPILVEKDVLNEAKDADLNISAICRDALLKALGDSVLREKYDKFLRIPTKIRAEIVEILDKNISLTAGCRGIIKKNTGISVTENEIIYWFEQNGAKYRDLEG